MTGPIRSIPPFSLSAHKVHRQPSLKRLPPIALVMTMVTTIVITNRISPVSAQAEGSIQVPTEIPEEVLRQEIILEGRSPLDGKPLTATEYVELQAELEHLNQVTPTVSPKLQQLVMLVKLRKFLKTVLPILPIK
jgi:hypothetical protein